MVGRSRRVAWEGEELRSFTWTLEPYDPIGISCIYDEFVDNGQRFSRWIYCIIFDRI